MPSKSIAKQNREAMLDLRLRKTQQWPRYDSSHDSSGTASAEAFLLCVIYALFIKTENICLYVVC